MSKRMFFYAGNQLASVQRGANRFDIFRGAQTPLAEREAKQLAILLAADRANSALQLRKGTSDHNNAYSPYGHLLHATAHTLLAYNGEYRDLHGFYFLGNGNRAYSPTLMRFISPDRAWIFRQDNHNAYGYCAGDPINRIDPSGNTWMWVKRVLRAVGVMKKPSKQTQANMQIARLSDVPTDIQIVYLESVPLESEVEFIKQKISDDINEMERLTSRAQNTHQDLHDISSEFNPPQKEAVHTLAGMIVDKAYRKVNVIHSRIDENFDRLDELNSRIRQRNSHR